MYSVTFGSSIFAFHDLSRLLILLPVIRIVGLKEAGRGALAKRILKKCGRREQLTRGGDVLNTYSY
jgi:hypothetical protein